jgi:anti-sigma factor RsiW
MDREYLEEHLSAYLDGELSDSEARQFETELEKYPDLKARLEKYRGVDRKMLDSDVGMPAEGYFDNLAMRIDARIEQTSPAPHSSFFERLLHPSPRVLAWAGSMAAVLLIAVVGYETYKPAVQEYSKPVRQMREMAAPAGANQETTAPDTVQRHEAAQPESPKTDRIEEKAKTESATPPAVTDADLKPSENIMSQEAENAVRESMGKDESRYEGSAAALSGTTQGTSGTATQPVVTSGSEKAARIKAEVAPAAAKPASLKFDEMLKVAPESTAVNVRRGKADEVLLYEMPVVKKTEDSLAGAMTGVTVLSEVEFDSLINEYTLRGTAEGDSLATEAAYRRAVQYRTPEYIDVARKMLEKRLEKAEGDKLRDHYTRMLESLSDL